MNCASLRLLVFLTLASGETPPPTQSGDEPGSVQPAQYSPGASGAASESPGYQPWSPDRWHPYPVVRPTPRFGWFMPPASGPGFYSVWDCVRGFESEKAPSNPYGNPLYESDFRFLDKPNARSEDWG